MRLYTNTGPAYAPCPAVQNKGRPYRPVLCPSQHDTDIHFLS